MFLLFYVGLLHSEEPPDETIDEDNEQYVDVNDYVSKESPRQQSPRQQSKPQRPSQEKCECVHLCVSAQQHVCECVCVFVCM